VFSVTSGTPVALFTLRLRIGLASGSVSEMISASIGSRATRLLDLSDELLAPIGQRFQRRGGP